MKSRLSAMLTIWSLALCAQPVNVGHHAGTHHTYNMVSVNQTCYYLDQALPFPGCCFEELHLVAINNQGQVKYRKPLFSYAWLSRCRIVVTPDQRLIIYGMTDLAGCDIQGSETKICLADTLGNVTSSLTLLSEIQDLQVAQDGSYFVLDHDKISRYNGSALSATMAPAVTSMSAILPMGNNRLLVSYSINGWGYLAICDSTGAILKNANITSVLRRLSWMEDGTLLGLSGGQLRRFNDTLKELYNTYSTLPPGLGLRDYVSRNDSVFGVAEDASGHPSYLLFRDDLSLQYSHTGNVTNTHPTGITVNGGTIHVIAEATSEPATHIFTSYFGCGLAGQLATKQDIGVTRFKVLQAVHQLSGYTPFGIVNLDATIRNFGADTIHSFTLNHFKMVTGTSYCLTGLNKLYTVPIAPGDSVIVTTGTFYTAHFINYQPGSPLDHQLCLYTSIPNQESDAQVGNDATCSNVTLSPAALGERTDAGIRVFPNPGNGAIVITGHAPGQAMEVFDSRGEFVFSKVLEKLEENIELSQPAGMYFVRIGTGAGSRTVKMIVE